MVILNESGFLSDPSTFFCKPPIYSVVHTHGTYFLEGIFSRVLSLHKQLSAHTQQKLRCCTLWQLNLSKQNWSEIQSSRAQRQAAPGFN